jgi:hypothetical protein
MAQCFHLPRNSPLFSKCSSFGHLLQEAFLPSWGGTQGSHRSSSQCRVQSAPHSGHHEARLPSWHTVVGSMETLWGLSHKVHPKVPQPVATIGSPGPEALTMMVALPSQVTPLMWRPGLFVPQVCKCAELAQETSHPMHHTRAGPHPKCRLCW